MIKFKDILTENSNIESEIKRYTNLVDYSKSGLDKMVGSKEEINFANTTQSKIDKASIRAIHKTQYIDEWIIEKRGVLDYSDSVISFSTGEGPREYKNYRYEILTDIPKKNILAYSKITPELFAVRSEDEIIAKNIKLQITNVHSDTNGDTGRPIYPIRIYCRCI